jgi:hypothetical protein
MLYTVLYTATMSATRTQIYLTAEQRRRLDERGLREGRPLASLIREAVDRYLEIAPEAEEALDGTFGTLPDLEVLPRAEWDRG